MIKKIFLTLTLALLLILPQVNYTFAQTQTVNQEIQTCLGIDRGTREWVLGRCEDYLAVCQSSGTGDSDYFEYRCDEMLPKYNDGGTDGKLDFCLSEPLGTQWKNFCGRLLSECKTTDIEDPVYSDNHCMEILAKSSAAAGQQCNLVTKDNFDICCPDTRHMTISCNNYVTGTTGTQGILNSGGAPNTNPTNGGSATVGATFGMTSSAPALTTCSAIKFDSLLDILIWLKCIIAAAVIPLIFTLAFLFFLWGMVQYIRNADNEKKREESKKFIYYGIIGLTVMVGVWGIVRIVNDTFGFGNTVPQLQTCLTTDPKNPCK
jgi:hypothetical protein